MQIEVNGTEKQVPTGITLLDLLEQLGFTEGRIAVEVNHGIVPRSQHAEHYLREGDRVEIVQAIGGG